MKIGLRIDADTFRGTKYGVPNLVRLLGKHDILATFFFSVGPDNMGRHILRLIRPSFLKKMLRSKGLNLYGWDILLKGTLWPGPVIGKKLPEVIRSASDAGHEAGFHAWDHHSWQSRIDKMSTEAIRISLKKGFEMLTRILDHPPVCSAVPGWKCNAFTLVEKTRLPFKYNSDCRGESLFYPLINGEELTQPQIPVTMPTYDEVIGRKGISNADYNEFLISLLNKDGLNVLTVHAEVEGMKTLDMFGRFLKDARMRGISFVPLGMLLKESSPKVCSTIKKRPIKGRQGWVACQSSAKERTGIRS